MNRDLQGVLEEKRGEREKKQEKNPERLCLWAVWEEAADWWAKHQVQSARKQS